MYALMAIHKDGDWLGNQALETTEGKEVQTFHTELPRAQSEIQKCFAGRNRPRKKKYIEIKDAKPRNFQNKAHSSDKLLHFIMT